MLRTDEVIKNPHEKECRQEAGRLINAHEEEIGFLRSTSEGIGAFAQMLQLAAGDRVIVNNLEFMSNIIPWKILEKRKGIRLDIIPHKQGKIEVRDIGERICSRTKVIVISSVQEVNGFRCDLNSIGKLARENDIVFIVDAIQHLGALPMDVKRSGIDLLIAGGHKWLFTPFGIGLFYVRRELLKRLEPLYLGWMNIDPENWMDLGRLSYSPIRDYALRNDSAQKFMISAIDIVPGIPAFWESLKLINQMGIENIAERILLLTSLLIEELDGKVPLASPLEKEHRSGIVTVETEEAGLLVEKLKEKKIYVSASYASGTGGIRIAPHFFNTEDEITGVALQLRKLV
jgi:selenocysteine lyase/cysteine desulfurase